MATRGNKAATKTAAVVLAVVAFLACFQNNAGGYRARTTKAAAIVRTVKG